MLVDALAGLLPLRAPSWFLGTQKGIMTRQTSHDNDSCSTEDLLLVMARPNDVLEAFDRERLELSSASDTALSGAPEELALCDLEDQERFARLLSKYWDENTTTPLSYLLRVLKRFVATRVSDDAMESETLMELVLASTAFAATMNDAIPDPDTSCHLVFRHSAVTTATSNTSSPPIPLVIRIFPYHNDVALRVWEAGVCLAEFLLDQPQYIAGKHCVELGAGTGITGLVAAGMRSSADNTIGGAASVCCTDFTLAALQNMRHNIDINQEWLMRQRQQSAIGTDKSNGRVVTVGYLDWGEYGSPAVVNGTNDEEKTQVEVSDDSSDSPALSDADVMKAMNDANVMLAADVIYDPNEIESLARAVYRFLDNDNSENKMAIFATTLRNKDSFALFETSLERHDIKVDYVLNQPLVSSPSGKNTILAQPPVVFPVSFTQKRKEVRIAILTLNQSHKT